MLSNVTRGTGRAEKCVQNFDHKHSKADLSADGSIILNLS
jgi:hypothetical protein